MLGLGLEGLGLSLEGPGLEGPGLGLEGLGLGLVHDTSIIRISLWSIATRNKISTVFDELT